MVINIASNSQGKYPKIQCNCMIAVQEIIMYLVDLITLLVQ